MRIVKCYSHLNGEEYLIVHHKEIYEEILSVLGSINANQYKTKISKEKTTPGKILYNPDAMNRAIKEKLSKLGWSERRYKYCVTKELDVMTQIVNLPFEQQTSILKDKCVDYSKSYNQTDFVKDMVAVEVQFGKYSFVAYDLFVKHLLFYSSGVINVGVEILPMREMQQQMSSGVSYFEGELYKVLKGGRTNPPVPLLIIGIAP